MKILIGRRGPQHRRRFVGAARLGAPLLIAGAMVVAGCGSGDDDADSPVGSEPAPTAAGADDTNDDGTQVGTQASTGEAADPGGGEAATPVPGGTGRILSNSQPLRLDPQLHIYSLPNAPMMSAIFGQLAAVNPATGGLEPYFLTDISPNDDFTVWTLVLHPDLLFSDGTPFDAAAIEYNMTRAADPELGSRFLPVAEGLTFNVVDDVTLEITLPSPDSTFDMTVVSSFSAVGSPTAIEAQIAAGEEVGLKPVGAGPFMVESWEPGARAVLVRNPNFERFRPGQPYLDELVLEVLPDEGQQRAAVVAGDAQMAYAFGQGPADEMLAQANAIVTPLSGAMSLNLNQSTPPFDDIRARRAVLLAIDRVQGANAFNPGTAPATTLFAETSPFYNEEYTFLENDRDEAQRLFDELAAEGKPVDFTYTTTDAPQHQILANFIAAELAGFQNVSVTIETLQGPDFSARVTNASEYQMAPFAWNFSSPMPTLKDFVHSEGTLNQFRWVNETVDEALAEIQATSDIEVQREAWGRIQQAYIEDVVAVPLAKPVVSFAYADGFAVSTVFGTGSYPDWGTVGFTS